MANARSGNTYYIDTQYATNEELAVKNLKVLGVVVTSTAAGAILSLTDSGTAKFTFKVAADLSSQYFNFSDSPVLFQTSVRPTTLTNAVATVIIQESSGG